MYIGEISPPRRGDIGAARRTFAVAAELFKAQHDAEGACQSILAESALAAWQGDHAHAWARALAAIATAEAAGLAWQQGWAAWQLGCLAAENDISAALAYFGRAGAVATMLGRLCLWRACFTRPRRCCCASASRSSSARHIARHTSPPIAPSTKLSNSYAACSTRRPSISTAC